MKRMILLLVVAVAAILAGCSFGTVIDLSSKEGVGKENILQNSGFESASTVSSVPINWSVVTEKEFPVEMCAISFHSGVSSLRIDQPESDISLVSDSFEIDNTSVYYSRCFVRTDKMSNKPLTLHLIAFNKDGDIVNKYSQEMIPSEEWSAIDFNSGFFKDSAILGRLVISVPEKNDNSFWIDDAEIFKVHTFAFSQE